MILSSNLTPILKANGVPAYLYLNSINGTQGGLATASSDLFQFPSQYLGNTGVRVFLAMKALDSVTQGIGFYVASGNLVYY